LRESNSEVDQPNIRRGLNLKACAQMLRKTVNEALNGEQLAKDSQSIFGWKDVQNMDANY